MKSLYKLIAVFAIMGSVLLSGVSYAAIGSGYAPQESPPITGFSEVLSAIPVHRLPMVRTVAVAGVTYTIRIPRGAALGDNGDS